MALHTKLKELEQVILQIRELAQFQVDQLGDSHPFSAYNSHKDEDLQTGPAPECIINREDSHKLENQELQIVQLLNDKTNLQIKINELECQLNEMINENREITNRMVALRNEVIELRGMIRVVCRIKPANEINLIRFGERSVEINSKKFIVDKTFGPAASQSDVYGEFESLIESIIEGYHVCIFAYGQTGSGKTHTMSGTDQEKGLVVRACESIINIVDKLEGEGFSSTMEVIMIEIYNETVKDLISKQLIQVQDEGGTLKLKNCEGTRVESISEIQELIREAGLRRATGETCSNTHSSRSHMMVIISLRLSRENEVREGALVLVDLAGSERLSESKAENERLKETQHINKSLSALGNVFTALKRGDKHVPFRDSKLTHIMREHLTGKSRTAMIVNINPASISESVCSMRFASKVSECALGAAENNIHILP